MNKYLKRALVLSVLTLALNSSYAFATDVNDEIYQEIPTETYDSAYETTVDENTMMNNEHHSDDEGEDLQNSMDHYAQETDDAEQQYEHEEE